MAQVLFATATLPLETDLDANFTELYTRTQLLKGTSQAVGVAITPNAWGILTGIEGSSGSLAFNGPSAIYMTQNLYFNGTAWIYKSTAAASIYTQSGGTHQWGYAASGTAGAASTLTQVMTLDGSGNFLLGQAAVGYQNSNSWYSGGGTAAFSHASGTTTGTLYIGFGYNGASIGSITQSGTTAVLYNTTSDERLKDHISDAAPAGDLLDSVRVRQFDWKADGSHQSYGFVAQELAEVVPAAVHTPVDPDDMMAVDYSKLVPLLVKEVQSLRARLAAAHIA